MNLGKIIKDLRKQTGYKQKVFADKCNITPSYLSQIENNIRDPNISILKVIADNLQVPLPVLFFLSMEEEDIHPSKRKSFNLLAPALKSLVNEFFKDNSVAG